MKGNLGHIFADMQQMFQDSSIHVSGLQIGHSAILRPPYPKRDDCRVELPLDNHNLRIFITSPCSSSQQHLKGAAPCIHDVYLCHDIICAMAVNVFIVRLSCVCSPDPRVVGQSFKARITVLLEPPCCGSTIPEHGFNKCYSRW
jgi:hypothetical protein